MVANLKVFQQFRVWDSEAAMLLMAAAIAISLSTCHLLFDSCSGHVLLLQARSVVEYWAFLLKLIPNLWIYFSQWLYKPLNTLYYRPLLFKPLSKFCLQLRKYTLKPKNHSQKRSATGKSLLKEWEFGPVVWLVKFQCSKNLCSF